MNKESQKSEPMNIIEVPYVYLNAEQVADLQKKVCEEESWKHLRWGNHGPKGDQDATEFKTLADCDTDHLEAILITQPQLPPEYRAAILELLKTRYAEMILGRIT
jgi:hypothetical protein